MSKNITISGTKETNYSSSSITNTYSFTEFFNEDPLTIIPSNSTFLGSKITSLIFSHTNENGMSYYSGNDAFSFKNSYSTQTYYSHSSSGSDAVSVPDDQGYSASSLLYPLITDSLNTIKVSINKTSLYKEKYYVKATVNLCYVPYTINLITRGLREGQNYNIELYPDTTDDYSFKIKAKPIACTVFDHWEIDNINCGTDPELIIQRNANTSVVNIVAVFKDYTYTINYHVIGTSSTDNLVYSQVCNYYDEYTALTDSLFAKTGYTYNGSWLFKSYKTDLDTQIDWTRPLIWHGTEICYINADPPNQSNYTYNFTATGITIYGIGTSSSSPGHKGATFTQLNSNNNAVIDVYTIEALCRYVINYKLYTSPTNQNTYTTKTNYYYYDNSDILTLCNLSDMHTLSTGTKFKNTLINSWFIQDELPVNLENQISTLPRATSSNINLYGYVEYIDYTVTYHYINENNIELSSQSQQCKYATSYTRLNKLEDKAYYYQEKWYSDNHSSDLANQSYAQNYNGNTASILIPWTGFAYNSSFSNLTTTDGDTIHYYSYYIPYSWKVEYWWNDSYDKSDPTFDPPATQWHVYNREPETIIANIPTFEEYDITGAGTKSWKYLDENNEEQINVLTTIPKTSTQEYSFYTDRTPHGRTITVSSNNTSYGTIEIDGPIPEANIYREGSTVTFRIKSIADGCHFHDWNDGSPLLERTITVGGHNYNYIAQFHQNSDHAPGILGLYVGTQLVRGVYLGTTPIYKGVT